MTDADLQAQILDAAERLLVYLDQAGERCRVSPRAHARLHQLIGDVGAAFQRRVACWRAERREMDLRAQRLRQSAGVSPRLFGAPRC